MYVMYVMYVWMDGWMDAVQKTTITHIHLICIYIYICACVYVYMTTCIHICIYNDM